MPAGDEEAAGFVDGPAASARSVRQKYKVIFVYDRVHQNDYHPPPEFMHDDNNLIDSIDDFDQSAGGLPLFGGHDEIESEVPGASAWPPAFRAGVPAASARPPSVRACGGGEGAAGG